jgi:hypothetical protein
MSVEPKNIITLLRAEIQKAGSATAWANNASIDRTVVSAVLHHKRSIPKSLVRALGLRRALFLTNESPAPWGTGYPAVAPDRGGGGRKSSGVGKENQYSTPRYQQGHAGQESAEQKDD